jgi:hypothetical protein
MAEQLSALGGAPPGTDGNAAPASSVGGPRLVDYHADEIAALRRELEQLRGIMPPRVDVDPDGVEQGLAKLVLTLVEFLRQLLERQAVRRMEGGTLTDDEVERVGLALMRLEEKVHDLARQFGVNPAELNVELGPLGRLL